MTRTNATPGSLAPRATKETTRTIDGTTHARALEGTTLARRYRITRLIRETDVTTVFEAHDLRVGAMLEIETTKVGYDVASPACRALEHEASVTAEIAHPVVLAPRDVGLLDDYTTFIVRERREGAPLHELVRLAGPLPPSDVARVAVDLLSALSAAHDKDIVHGALAPEHVIVVSREHVTLGARLSGFESARLPDSDGSLGFERAAFVAPELLAGRAPSPSSDIYAVGAVLFYAATGCSPESARRTAAAFGLLPSRLARILLRALHPDASERFECAREMLHAFLALAEPTIATEPPRLRPVARSGTYARVAERTRAVDAPRAPVTKVVKVASASNVANAAEAVAGSGSTAAARPQADAGSANGIPTVRVPQLAMVGA